MLFLQGACGTTNFETTTDIKTATLRPLSHERDSAARDKTRLNRESLKHAVHHQLVDFWP